MGKLLAPLSGWGEDPRAAEAAFALGKAFRYFVHGLHIRQNLMSVFPVFGEGVSIAGVKEIVGAIEDQAAAQSAAAKAVFLDAAKAATAEIVDQRCLRPGFAARYEEGEGFPAEEIAKRARLCDFTVFSAAAARPTKVFGEALNQVILGARRPVYLAQGAVDLAKPAIVAWDGSTEAANALFAARPFLEATSKIYVAQIEGDIDAPDRGVSDCAWAIEYLCSDGFAAEPASLNRDNSRRRADQLIDFAEERDAGLIVMGAFGHSRLREAIIGGMTLRMIERAPTPLLLAH